MRHKLEEGKRERRERAKGKGERKKRENVKWIFTLSRQRVPYGTNLVPRSPTVRHFDIPNQLRSGYEINIAQDAIMSSVFGQFV